MVLYIFIWAFADFYSNGIQLFINFSWGIIRFSFILT